MSASTAVLGPPVAAAISAARAARAKVNVFIFWSSICPGSAAEAACVIRTLEARGCSRRAGAGSGQGSRGMVGRRTVETVAEEVVRDQVCGPDRMPQRQGCGRPWASLHVLQAANRNERAVLAVRTRLFVRAARHVG